MTHEALLRDMLAKGIDIPLTEQLLNEINSGRAGNEAAVEVTGVPPVDGKTIIALNQAVSYTLDASLAKKRLEALGLAWPDGVSVHNGAARFGYNDLTSLGEAAYGITAWGVLNGGSATSYADIKKNKAIGADVFASVQSHFESAAALCEGRPKGISPAYSNPDGSSGESFLLIKMRIALLEAARHIRRFGKGRRPPLAFFQMTSDGTDEALRAAYDQYALHPWLKDLIAFTGNDVTRPLSEKQKLIAALTHSSLGMPKKIFDEAYGKKHSALPLPGGHGQSFAVLAPVYTALLNAGYKYAYIGNVDNMGYYPNPVELALMALSGAEASFEFSYRTPVDIKGGILVTTKDGRRTVADIGQALSFDTVRGLEKSGAPVLFNCATGLFDLERLAARLPEIVRRLPLRISDQDKDAGRYSQAEQSTWEVIGLIDKPLGFAVQKQERFIAAKLLTETILASGLAEGYLPPDVAETARSMSDGLTAILRNACGLELRNGRWQC